MGAEGTQVPPRAIGAGTPQVPPGNTHRLGAPRELARGPRQEGLKRPGEAGPYCNFWAVCRVCLATDGGLRSSRAAAPGRDLRVRAQPDRRSGRGRRGGAGSLREGVARLRRLRRRSAGGAQRAPLAAPHRAERLPQPASPPGTARAARGERRRPAGQGTRSRRGPQRRARAAAAAPARAAASLPRGGRAAARAGPPLRRGRARARRARRNREIQLPSRAPAAAGADRRPDGGELNMLANDLETRLRELGDERAPATLLPSVLARVGATDTYFELPTEIGTAFVVHGPDGISAVHVADSDDQLWRRLGRRLRRQEPPPELRERVVAALSGQPVDLRFDLQRLTPFERDVLMKALEIPRGEVRTYGWIAREIGRPKAVRAVGSALARNPIPLFIPCHRVVRSDGTIGQYGLG